MCMTIAVVRDSIGLAWGKYWEISSVFANAVYRYMPIVELNKIEQKFFLKI